MKTLQNYFSKEALKPLLIAVVVLATLSLLTQSLAGVDIVVNDRASMLAYIKITLLALPQLISIILPFAVFIATSFAVQRLLVDNEYMVAFAGGMTRWAVITPVLRLASLIILLNLALGTWAQPTTYKLMREALYDLRTNIATSIVRPGEFVSPTANLTIYAQDVQNGTMHDVMIYDDRDHAKPLIYFAQFSTFLDDADNMALALTNTTRQSVNADGAVENVTFSETRFELNTAIAANSGFLYKPTDRYLGELFHPSETNYWDRQNANALRAEGHSRLASPLYNLVFALIALAALLGGNYNSLGYNGRLFAAGALALFVRLTGFYIEASAVTMPAFNYAQYVFPLFVCAICMWMVLHKNRFGRPAGRLVST